MSRTFQYTERPCGVVLGRRGLIKVVGVCAVVAGATGWGVVELLANRNCILLARQAGQVGEYAASARVFCKLAEAKIAEAYTYVMNSTTEDVALFKAVENEF